MLVFFRLLSIAIFRAVYCVHVVYSSEQNRVHHDTPFDALDTGKSNLRMLNEWKHIKLSKVELKAHCVCT